MSKLTTIFRGAFFSSKLPFVSSFPVRYAPGPGMLPLLGTLLSSYRVFVCGELYQENRENFAKYGPVYQTMVPSLYPRYNFVVSDPVLMKKIAQSNLFQERDSSGVMKHVAPNGLLNLESGEKASQHRAALTKIIGSKKSKERFVKIMNEVAHNMVCKIEPNASNELSKLFVAATFDIIGKTAFGLESNAVENPDNDVAKSFQSVFKSVVPLMAIPQPILKWTGKKQELDGIIQNLRHYVCQSKNKVSLEHKGCPSVFHELEKEGIPEDEIIDESLTLMIGGHETTGHTLSWTAYLLAKHPDYQKIVLAEIDRFFEQHQEIGSDVFDKFVFFGSHNKQSPSNFPHLEASILESLRIFPALPAFIRYATEDVELPDSSGKVYKFPKGSRISIGLPGCNLSAENWENPETFDPDRFLKTECTAFAKKGFLPFGSGHRMCLGAKFALTESIVLLAKLLQKFELQLTPGAPESSGKTFITLFPEKGVHVHCIPRN